MTVHKGHEETGDGGGGSGRVGYAGGTRKARSDEGSASAARCLGRVAASRDATLHSEDSGAGRLLSSEAMTRLGAVRLRLAAKCPACQGNGYVERFELAVLHCTCRVCGGYFSVKDDGPERAELAERLSLPEAGLKRLERVALDRVTVSTLRDYVAVLGGSLQVVMPDGRRLVLELSGATGTRLREA
jgi:hypothetical protein